MTVEVRATGPALPPLSEATNDETLDMPAHLPPVALPPLRAAQDQPMQKMAPAPTLPPTTYDGPAAPPEPHPKAETSLVAPPPHG